MKIGKLTGLFPLVRLNEMHKNYFIDQFGRVYSSKTQQTPKQLTGFNERTVHYVTLTGVDNVRRKLSTSRLLGQARLHSAWIRELSDNIDVTVPKNASTLVGSPTSDKIAISVQDGIKGRGYIIGQVQGEALVFGSKPRIHSTVESVEAEIERLANKSPGMQLVYLKIQRSVKAATLVWE